MCAYILILFNGTLELLRNLNTHVFAQFTLQLVLLAYKNSLAKKSILFLKRNKQNEWLNIELVTFLAAAKECWHLEYGGFTLLYRRIP